MTNLKLKTTIVMLLTIAMLTIGCASQISSESSAPLESGSEVEWETALEILKSGDVAEAHQSHDLSVTFIMKDSRLIHTIEPTIDDIFAEVKACGAPCANISMATEDSIESDRKVEWETALEILKSGDVAEAHQSHDLSVTFIMKDGRLIHTTEPSIDDIFAEVKACGASCADISLATE